MNSIVKSLFLCLLIFCSLPAQSASDAEGEWTPLFNGKDLAGWRIFLDPNAKVDPKEVFKVEDGIIVVSGKPFGYMITEKSYENYVFKVQWRWGKKIHQARNSGVLLHVSGADKIWPKAAEAQMMSGHAGDFWLIGHFKLKVDPKREDPKATG